MHAISGNGFAANVHEHPGILWTLNPCSDEPAKGFHRLRPKRAHADLSAFAVQTNRGVLVEIQIANRHCCDFAGSCSGIIQKEDQRMIAHPLETMAIRSRQQGVNFVFFAAPFKMPTGTACPFRRRYFKDCRSGL